MLILEGPDLVGKTTLAQKLVKKSWGYPWKMPAIYAHFTALPPTWKHPESYRPYITKYTVMDRFHLSEYCYSIGARKTPTTSIENMIDLNRWLKEVGTFTVIITATEEFLREQWARKTREEMFTLEQVLAVNGTYQAAIALNLPLGPCMHFELKSELDFPADNPKAMDGILNKWAAQMSWEAEAKRRDE